MGFYYQTYVPKNERHFNNMLRQFRLCQNKKELADIEILWVFDLSVNRQDIIVALGRVEREKGWNK